MKRVALALVAVLLVLAGCGDDGAAPDETTQTPQASAEDLPDLPDCADIWVEGRPLPADYEGCLVDGAVAEDTVTKCVGKGRLVRHQTDTGEASHFALTGRRVQAYSLDGLDEAFLVCLPQDGV